MSVDERQDTATARGRDARGPSNGGAGMAGWERWGLVLVLVVLGLAVVGSVVAPERFRPALVEPEPPATAVVVERRDIGPAPTVRRGPKAIYKGELVATWIVSGAGDPTYNGTYAESGTYGGQPAYTNGSRWLWKTTGLIVLSANKGDEDNDQWYVSMEADLPGNPWVAVGGAAPAPEVAGGEYVHFGVSEADTALWKVAGNYRYSKYGVKGGSKDVAERETVFTSIFRYRAPVLPSGGTYNATVSLDGHIWRTTTGLAGHDTLEQTGVISGLPSSTGSDDWAAWLGEAGPKTLTIELRRASDGFLVASDTYSYTMFIPHLVLTAPAPGAVVDDIFEVTLEFDECYYWSPGWAHPTLTLLQGENTYGPYETTGLEAGGSCTTELDLAAIDPGDGTGNGLPAGALTLRASLEMLSPTDAALTHVESYEIEITSPLAGAESGAGIAGCAAALRTGWYLGSSLNWWVYNAGVWALRATQVLAAQYYVYVPYEGLTRRFNACDVLLTVGDSLLRVDWCHGSGETLTTLATDQVAITVAEGIPESGGEATTAPEDAGSGPWARWFYPPSGATVTGAFTGHVNYGNFSPTAAGHLRIIAVGPETVTLYDDEVALAASGTLSLALDFGAAAAGTYELWVVLTGASGETAMASSQLIVAAEAPANDPPTCTIISPGDAESLHGAVTIDVEATDDLGVWRVAVMIDDMSPMYLYAPNTSGGTYRFTWDSRPYVNGAHTITAVARDVQGLTATATSTVNLANAQADRRLVRYSPQLGVDANGQPLNLESATFSDRDYTLGIMDPVLPAPPADPKLRYNVTLGYNKPGLSKSWADYRVFQPRRIVSLLPREGRQISLAICGEPQQTVASWEIAAADMTRLAVGASGRLYGLCLTPHSVVMINTVTYAQTAFADLSGLASAPVDMAFAGGKLYVAYGDRVIALDPDTGDLHYELLLPWPDEVTAVSRLAAAGNDLAIAATLSAGGSRLYRFTGTQLVAVCDHDHEITAMQKLGAYLWAGNDNGDVLRVGTGSWDLMHATGQAAVVSLGSHGAAIYAGSGDEGRIYRAVSGWGQAGDLGFDQVRAIASFNGWAYVGGNGTGGQYLWREQSAGSWIQALELAGATSVNDLVAMASAAGGEQLFAATTGDGAACALHRVEIAEDGELVTGAEWFADGASRDYAFEVIG